MGPDIEALLRRLVSAGQEHLAEHARSLAPAERAAFCRELDAVDLGLVRRLLADPVDDDLASGAIEPFPAVSLEGSAAESCRARGEALLAAGKVAAFVVAGGQGSRLGHEGPKGTYPATPLTGKPLFQVFAEKLLARGRRAGRAIPLLVMTSPLNDGETREFFARHGHFGLDPADVAFFPQGTLPAVDATGRLLLAEPTRLFRSPDGHGGSLRALHGSGELDRLRDRGVEHVFYFQVDNPLVDLCDPVFLGHHVTEGSEYSCKVVRKRDPGEKVGVVARRGGRPCVVEYSDLPADLRDARLPDGSLRFKEGSIAIHALTLDFIARLNEGGFQLPFHQARKAIPVYEQGRFVEVPGIKFETFVFDALPFARQVAVLEVPREREFSPIKNRDGADSPATSRADQTRLFAGWLERVGVTVPRDGAGQPRHTIEISPLFADGPDALLARRQRLPDAVAGDLLLEGT